jgi:hypothetical protein
MSLSASARRRQQSQWKPPFQRGTHLKSASTRRFLPRLELLEDRTVPSTLTVTSIADNGDGSLRAAVAAAQSGDQIIFDPSLAGQTITLTSGQLAITNSLDIEGPGADQLAISGDHGSRIFSISAGVAVTIAGLTITDGLASGALAEGSGILNNGSTLTVANDILSNNEAITVAGGTSRGGAISNISGAMLTVTDSLLIHNQCRGGIGNQGSGIFNSGSRAAIAGSTLMANLAHGGGGGGAAGGGIYNDQGASVTVTACLFIGNQAISGDGGVGSATAILLATARGGGIYNNQATVTVANSTFTGNQAAGGNGAVGGSASISIDSGVGGGIANAENGILFISGSTFAENRAIGGNHATGGTSANQGIGVGRGGGLSNIGVAEVTNSTFDHNEAWGGSGNTGGSGFSIVGVGRGGAIDTAAALMAGDPAVLVATNLTLRHNEAIGGSDNIAGDLVGEAIGGGLVTDGSEPGPGAYTASISDSMITDNQARGGQGTASGNGRDGLGGGIANLFGAVLTVSGSTLSGNQALGGAGGLGGNGGNGLGGGIFNDGPSTFPTNPDAPTVLTLQGSTLTDNEAKGGAVGIGGSSVGLGAGGGISSAGILTVLGSSLSHNLALGHDGEGGADGGDGLGGGLYIAGGTVSVLATNISHNRAFGGDGDAGSNGGNGLGGGVYVASGTVIVVASDISYNQALGGLGDGDATDALGVGGGVYNLGTFLRDALTVIGHNRASDSNDDGFGC